MATYYVDSNAVGTGTGANWANAFTTLAAAVAAKAAGDVFYVAHDHAESTAGSLNIAPPGTLASPCRIICVNKAGSVPPVSADLRATATVSTTGNNGITLGSGTVNYWEGIIFNCGTGAVNPIMNIGQSNSYQVFKNCAFRKLGTNAQSFAFAIGTLNGTAEHTFINCTFQFGNTGDAVQFQGNVQWLDTPSAITGATFGTLNFSNARQVLIEGVDLSAHTGSIIGASSGAGNAVLKDCKLNASFAVSTPTVNSGSVSLIRCDSGDTNYRSERYMYQGTLTTETTTVRTGGASDGTTTIAWKIVPTANNERDFPFECFPISVWNETTGSAITLTVEGTWGGGAVPTTAGIWMDVEYLGTSGFPLGDTIYGGPADVLASGTNHTASSETWGAGGTTKFKMSVSVTPQEKGPITVYIKYANVTNTVWIDPKITVS